MDRVLKQNYLLQMDTRINLGLDVLMDDVFGYGNFIETKLYWHIEDTRKTKKDLA